jgi:tRNA-specific 2-thiouridylase
MSGGVDSSVAAALLRDQGFDVVGVMLRLWSEPGTEESNRCCSPESMSMARRAAAVLDIPFHVIDAKAPFRAAVVQGFLDGYGGGATPNPCLECNRQIRWTFLLEHAMALGADFMATGHYARLEKDESGTVKLLRAVDASKDQSYVLHVLDQTKLRRTLLPVGEYMKADVRRLAQSHALPTASRRESQDLCFLAGGDYRDFLRRQRPELFVKGNIVTVSGEVLGEHGGLVNYTIGQRKGLGVASSAPLYVLRKDVASNTLVVGVEEALGQRELTAARVRWTSGQMVTDPFRAQVKTRYTARHAPAEVVPMEGGHQVRIAFDAPQRDITRGQAAVFYQDEYVIGGGIIE